MCSSNLGQSNPYATEIMKTKKLELAAGIKDSDALLKRLVDYGILTPEQRLVLSYYKTHFERTTRVLDILISQGEYSCRMFFYPCLKQVEPGLYQIIRKYVMDTDKSMQGPVRQLAGHLLDRDNDKQEKSIERFYEKESTRRIQEASVKLNIVSRVATNMRPYPPSQTPGHNPTPLIHLLTASGKGDVANMENMPEGKHASEVTSPGESSPDKAGTNHPVGIHNYSMTTGSPAEETNGKDKSLLQRPAESAYGDAVKVLQGRMNSRYLERNSQILLGFDFQGDQDSFMRPVLEGAMENPYYFQPRPSLQEESQGFPENSDFLDTTEKEESDSGFPEMDSLEEAIKILLTAGINADSGILSNAFHHNDQAVIQLLLKYSSVLPPETRELALFEAVRKNLPELLTALADEGTDLNVQNDRLYTPLLLAAEMDRTMCAEVLIQKGASMEAKTACFDSALHLAVKTGAVYTAELLLENGMNPNLPGWGGQTPLHVAAWHNKHEMVDMLMDSGAQVNAFTMEQSAPLHITSVRGNLETARQLIQHEADINVKNKFCMTPLHLAAQEGHKDMVELLLCSGADPNVIDKEKKTPLHWAAFGNYVAVVKSMLAHKAKFGARDMDGYSPLHYAALQGNVELVKVLLEAGKNKNINERNIYRKTPLHLAAEQGHGDLIKVLMNYRAAVNAFDNNRDTPLHCACKTGRWNSVLSLLSCTHGEKPDLQATNSLGKTPLQVAEGTPTERQEQIVSLLKKKMFLIK